MQTEQEIPTDDEFELSLLDMLANTKYQVYAFHGELLDAWYADKEQGPLLIFIQKEMLADDYGQVLEEQYPDSTVFCMHLDPDRNPETSACMIIMSHINFGAIAMFGQELTPLQFAEQLNMARQADDDNS